MRRTSSHRRASRGLVAETSMRLAVWGVDFRDQGYVDHSHAIAAGGEDDEGATVGRKLREISSRDLAWSAIGEADREGAEGGGFEIFLNGLFGHMSSRFLTGRRSHWSARLSGADPGGGGRVGRATPRGGGARP